MQPDNRNEDTASEAGGPAEEGLSRQFVTFTIAEQAYAVDMMPVQEIIRLPELVRVPLAPASLLGLANLRGKVLPIVSLRRILGLEDGVMDDATRAVVINLGQPVGLVVDRVASVVDVDPAAIEEGASVRSTAASEMVSGVIRDLASRSITMVLDCAALVAREFAELDASLVKGQQETTALLAGAEEVEEDSDERQLVSFDIAEQEYAVDIREVQEIVQFPEDIVRVPRAAAHVIGVMNLRGRLLPVMDLRLLFGMPDRPVDDKTRVVVLALAGGAVGISVDAVSEVLRVAEDSLEAMPGLLAADAALAEITHICRLDSGKRLVSIIDPQRIFEQAPSGALLAGLETEATDAGSAEEDADADDDEQVVLFRLGSDEFGVSIKAVQEIVRVPEGFVRMPGAPGCVEGVINLRGSVLPVVDLRLRLGLERIDRSDRQRIVVLIIDGVRTGFVVDQVAEVLRLPKAVVEETPRISSAQGGLLSRMANLEKQQRMVQILEAERLLDGVVLPDDADLARAA